LPEVILRGKQLIERKNIGKVSSEYNKSFKVDLDLFLSTFNETCGEGDISSERLDGLTFESSGKTTEKKEVIAILDSSFIGNNDKGTDFDKGVCIKIKNVSGNDIGTAIIEVMFCTAKGDAIEVVKKSINDFERDKTRTLFIYPPKVNHDFIDDYDVRIDNVIITPIPTAAGNDDIKILTHLLRKRESPYPELVIQEGGVTLSIINVSDKTIAKAIFQVLFYDKNGNVVCKATHTAIKLKPSIKYMFDINYDRDMEDYIRSYSASILEVIKDL
jgi:hypothetical protein